MRTSAVRYLVPSGAPEANGFITPTSAPRLRAARASPAVRTVFPTPVSVPVTNSESTRTRGAARLITLCRLVIKKRRRTGAVAGSAVWHPNTQMGEWAGFDTITRGEGVWLVDSGGRRLLDGVASMWCNVWGHSNPEMVSAISRQAARLQHSPMFNLTNGPAEELARRLVGVSPGMRRVFLSDNGSSAMEVAFKMALQYWKNAGEGGRDRIAALEGGYHGDTFGAMSVGYGSGFFGRFRGSLFPALRFPAPGRLPPAGETAGDAAQRCLGGIESALAEDGGRIAAFVMESGAQLAGGAAIFPRGFQRGVRRACRRNGVLFVLDEVATGFGRLGPMVEYTEQGGHPDIVAYGKMLTGGYLTMAATLATKRVYDAFLGGFGDGVHLFHGHTYTGNPIAAAAAVENMKMYRRHGLIGRVRRTSRALAGHARELSGLGPVVDVRHKGMLAGVEVALPDGGIRGARGGAAVSANKAFFDAGRRNGVYLRTLGNVVMLVPPLVISEAELSELAARTARTILDVCGGA